MEDNYTGENKPKMTPLVGVLLVVIALLLLVIGGLVGFYFSNSNSSPFFPPFMDFDQMEDRMDEMMEDEDFLDMDLDEREELKEEIEKFLEENLKDAATDDSLIGSGAAASATWEAAPVEVNNFDVFSADVTDISEHATTYKIGTLDAVGPHGGATIYLMQGPCDGMCFLLPFYRFLDDDGELILLELHSDSVENSLLDKEKFTTSSLAISDLLQHETISAGELPITLHLDKTRRMLYEPSNTKTAFTASKVGKLLTTNLIDNENQTIYDKHGFYARAVDGTLLVYSMKPRFWSDDNIPKITFSDGTVNDVAYAYTDQGGCGATNYSFVVDQTIVAPEDLVKAGTVLNGFDNIYELKDENHKFLKDYYENSYYVFNEEEKMAYSEFLKDHPLLYFYDELNRLIQLENQEFAAPVECGKPVIYLYPETAQNVHVEVAPVGGFTYTDPEYGTGWDVLAQPNGQLTELSSGVDYPYLFWEGDGGLYEAPDKGFVVEVAHVNTFLQDSLSRLGLNKQERADFTEFWLPRMQDAPYYFVSFYGKDAMDALAPLNVTPEPDTIIRILMDFQELDAPIEVEGYELRAPARDGFTVVEWGGVLR